MIQEIILGLVFLGALAYLTRLVVRSFKPQKGCKAGCSCSAANATNA